jgi:hypothetical protein
MVSEMACEARSAAFLDEDGKRFSEQLTGELAQQECQYIVEVG